MKRKTFQTLLQIIKPYWKKERTGRPKIKVKLALCLTLWRLANQTQTYRELVDRFGIGMGTAHAAFLRITKILSSLVKRFVKWPMSTKEFQKIIMDFQNLRANKPFPNVVGCVDGAHIEIPAPKKQGSSYYNRKGKHSIILQGVCDANLKFIDVFFGWPGRSHDAWVWRNSPLGKKLESGDLAIPPDCHLLGDSAYPLLEYLLVRFKDNGHLSDAESKFNVFLSSTRVVIEQAFGLLKGKFRMLKYLQLYKLSAAKNIVLSCVVLHNFIINNEGIDFEDIAEDSEKDSEEEDINENSNRPSTQAKQKREALCTLFMA